MIKDLTQKQYQAIYLLAVGKSFQQTADTIGVSKQTICNWRKNEVFAEEYKRVIAEQFFDL